MEGPRAPTELEYNDILKFLDQNLRPNEKWSIDNEFPTAFCPANRNNIRIIKEESQVLSHAVWRPLLVKTPIGIFKVAAIGSVVTDTNFRNQGLSTKVIQDCMEQAKAQGCDFAILWTNIYDFYRKMGFELAGTEISMQIDHDLQLPAGKIKILSTSKISAESVLRLSSQHTVSTFRTLDEIKRYLQIPNSRIYSAWDENGTMVAYAVEGKGLDLSGYVHEWGGSVSALMLLFQQMQRDIKAPITVIAPSHAQNLIRKFEENGITSNLGFLGMIKLLNPTNVFSKILRQARTELGVGNFILEQRENKFVFGVAEKRFETASEADMVRLLFGPLTPQEIHTFDPKTLELFEKIFPVKMWLWGWDSI